MPTRLLIDGYNFLKRSSLSALFDATDLDSARNYFLERLFEYKREKGVHVTVVFDATQGISLGRQRDPYRGIEIIYSRQGETADQVMIETIRKRLPGLVVVTSDRAILDEAKRHGVVFVTPDRLEASLDGAGSEDYPERTEKKGNPRRAPKQVRKARRAIRKI
jgi:uncharacterized protein